MVGSIGGTSNLVNMISFSYQQSNYSQGVQGGDVPPPPPPGGDAAGGAEQDKLGMFNAVDSDSSGGVSEEEYETLTEGILEVSGTEVSGSFSEYDLDEDGVLSGSELKSVLDEAGFAPPPPPPQVVSDAYAAQGGSDTEGSQITDEDLLSQLLEYLETRTEEDDLDITA